MNQIGEPFRPYNDDHKDNKDGKDGKGGHGFSKDFALIIVLFILLIIIGATWCGGFGGGHSCAPVYGYGPYYC